MNDAEINMQELLKELRQIIGEQALQIAVLKATITALSSSDGSNIDTKESD